MKKKNFDPFNNLKLDAYEQEIEDAIESDNLKIVPMKQTEKDRYAQYARDTIKARKKEARVNIRVNRDDLHKIQRKAAENALPYQTLISTILHHFATGKVKLQI